MATGASGGVSAQTGESAAAQDAGPDGVPPYVEFESIDKSYDGRTLVVRDLDLSVREGEFLTLLGPSGSGKTTCLMMLAGFETPTVRHHPNCRTLGARSAAAAAQHRRGVPELRAVPPPDGRRRTSPSRSTCAGWLPSSAGSGCSRRCGWCGWRDSSDRRPDQLYGGQQQRVAIGRSLVFEPSLVLMDEPLGNLDRSLREAMQYEIRRIHRSLGVTVVYVTHDQQEAMVMSDRIAVFNRGRIEQVASPEILYEVPERPFVARFIGGNNLLRGRGDRRRRRLLPRCRDRADDRGLSRGGRAGWATR